MHCLSTKCFIAIHCLILCKQEILEQKCMLLAGQQEVALKHEQFCMDTNARYFVKFYAQSPQACRKIGQFPMNCTFAKHFSFFSVMLVTSSTDIVVIDFLSRPDLISKELHTLNFSIIFVKPLSDIRALSFFIPFNDPNYIKAFSAHSPFL